MALLKLDLPYNTLYLNICGHSSGVSHRYWNNCCNGVVDSGDDLVGGGGIQPASPWDCLGVVGDSKLVAGSWGRLDVNNLTCRLVLGVFSEPEAAAAAMVPTSSTVSSPFCISSSYLPVTPGVGLLASLEVVLRLGLEALCGPRSLGWPRDPASPQDMERS